MIKTCWFATLREIGYSTELSITNPLPCQGIPAQSLNLQLRSFKDASPVGENAVPLGTLASGARINIDIEQILNNLSLQGDVVGALNQIRPNGAYIRTRRRVGGVIRLLRPDKESK